jgi:hypothetical protein
MHGELQRLMHKHRGEVPQLFNEPAVNGVMAVWGDLSLVPLDGGDRTTLRFGNSPHVGIMVDARGGSFREAVDAGIPVYRFLSGTGFVWIASDRGDGIGELRFMAINADALNGMSPTSSGPIPCYLREFWQTDCAYPTGPNDRGRGTRRAAEGYDLLDSAVDHPNKEARKVAEEASLAEEARKTHDAAERERQRLDDLKAIAEGRRAADNEEARQRRLEEEQRAHDKEAEEEARLRVEAAERHRAEAEDKAKEEARQMQRANELKAEEADKAAEEARKAAEVRANEERKRLIDEAQQRGPEAAKAAAQKGVAWQMSTTPDDMTDEPIIAVTSIQDMGAVKAEVRGQCLNPGVVRFSARIINNRSEATITMPGYSGQRRVNKLPAQTTAYNTVSNLIGNEIVIFDPATDLPANLPPEAVWQVLATVNTSKGTIEMRVFPFDPEVQKFYDTCRTK